MIRRRVKDEKRNFTEETKVFRCDLIPKAWYMRALAVAIKCGTNTVRWAM